MARIQVKQVSDSMQRMILVIVLLAPHHLVPSTNAQTVVPADPAEVNTWFKAAIKPLSQRTGSLDSNVAEAESAVYVINVSKDGTAEFTTIKDALDSVDNGNSNRVVINIGPGEYEEKITVERYKSYITFYGDPNDKPVITYGGTAADYGTVDSSTLIVEADYFVGANIIVEITMQQLRFKCIAICIRGNMMNVTTGGWLSKYSCLGPLNSAPRPDGKRKGAQAVAIRISGDLATFYNCEFIGFQDTVCDDKGRHFFKDCYIEGTVDFVFGEGRSLYLNTELHVIPGDPVAVIVAHARKNQDGEGGYSFVHCKVTGRGANAYLARAWMEAGRVVYSYCQLDDVVSPEGWSDNFKSHLQKTVYFGEYNNDGPGADTSKRVSYAKQLSDEEAQDFISLEYIDAAKWLLPPPSGDNVQFVSIINR